MFCSGGRRLGARTLQKRTINPCGPKSRGILTFSTVSGLVTGAAFLKLSKGLSFFAAGVLSVVGVAYACAHYTNELQIKREKSLRSNAMRNGEDPSKISSPVYKPGAYIASRPPFNPGNPLFVLFPEHQSLVIITADGKRRQVGLGNSKKRFWSELVLHVGGRYEELNEQDILTPIELWEEYRRKYGHFPDNVDLDKLNELTMTRGEAEQIPEFDMDTLLTVLYGMPKIDIDGTALSCTCRSTIRDLILQEQQLQGKEVVPPNYTRDIINYTKFHTIPWFKAKASKKE